MASPGGTLKMSLDYLARYASSHQVGSLLDGVWDFGRIVKHLSFMVRLSVAKNLSLNTQKPVPSLHIFVKFGIPPGLHDVQRSACRPITI